MSGFAAFPDSEGLVPGPAGSRAPGDPLRDGLAGGARPGALVRPAHAGHLVARVEPIPATLADPPARGPGIPTRAA
jgi:hypothetical protein